MKYKVILSSADKTIKKNIDAAAIKMVETYVVDQLILGTYYKMDLRHIEDRGTLLNMKYLLNNADEIKSELKFCLNPGRGLDNYFIEIIKDNTIEHQPKTFVFYSETIDKFLIRN